jgi:clan AA aspartic protease (TIGR02281 family)
MFQIVLSLMAGIFIGWNFHLFYSEIDKIQAHPYDKKQILSSSTMDQNLNKIIKKKKEEDSINYQPIQTKEIIQKFNQSNEITPSIQLSFEELLKKGNFYDAMAFYLEGDEEEIKICQKKLENYFKEKIATSPQKTIEEIEYYIDIEPNSQSMQHYLATYYLNQKMFKESLSIFQRLHDDFEDENYTIQLAQLYYHFDNYEESNSLLQEISNTSIYYTKAQRLLKKIAKKEQERSEYTYKVPLNKIGSHYTLTVKINHTPLILLLDTGASYTFVDEEKLPSITIEKEILLNTAGGEIIAQLAHADSLKIEEIELKDFRITLGSFKREDADGLLGMNFFEQFDFKIDQKEQLLYLSPKKRGLSL